MRQAEIEGEMSIERNIQLTKIAEEIRDVAKEICDEYELTKKERLEVARKIFKVPEQPSESKGAMTYEEARRWAANTEMSFGKHKGINVKDVPEEYIAWLADQPDFRRDLMRYVESEYYKGRNRVEYD